MGAWSNYPAGSTRDSAMPNIRGSLDLMFGSENKFANNSAIYTNTNANKRYGVLYNADDNNGSGYYTLYFDASRYNKIFGSATIVQPPAYYVYFWQRTA